MWPPPTLGARGWRLLDDVAFACEVVAVDVDAASVDVRYCDDGRVELCVDLLEFISNSSRKSSEPHDVHKQQTRSDCFEHLVRSDCAGALDVLTAFLDHVEWLRGLMRVSRRWRRRLLRRSLWRSVRIPRAAAADAMAPANFARVCNLLENVAVCDDSSDEEVAKDGNSTRSLLQTARVGDVVEELVLSGSAVTDTQVLQLIQCCGDSLERVALRSCSRVSFLLLYELTRLAKQLQLQQDKQQQCKSFVHQVDVWLCRGISPAYVRQLREHGAFERAGLCVKGPGFAIMEVSAGTWEWIENEATAVTMPSFRDAIAVAAAGDAGGEDEPREPICYKNLTVRFVPRSSLSALFQEHYGTQGNITTNSSTVAKALRGVRDHMDALSLTVVPLVRLDRVLGCAETSGAHCDHYSLVGMPTTPEDLLQLVRQHEDSRVELQLCSILCQLAPPSPEAHPEQSENDAHGKRELSLDARADKVFAMLRQTTTDLEAQVAHLERQVQRMTIAKNQAQHEYLEAQLELDRVAKEADRALLSLATSSTVLPPPPPPPLLLCIPTPTAAQQAGDELLPALPSNKQLQALGTALQHNAFAVLDGFVGAELSTSVHADIERMYCESRRATVDNSSTSTSSGGGDDAGGSDDATHAPATGAFQLGELAGGNTGRNLRYKLQHVRGDYMLWLDECDAFCPLSVQQVLRQLDRLVLERLPAHNLELRASSLLRKKAMATCYPGDGARYTKHCDNPNRNGRKLTAILYLNANWSPQHGGELQLHMPRRPRDPSSCSQQQQQDKTDGDDSDAITKVAPLMDRLLLFFSDRRVPHEVLPCLERNRFALTVWYLDYDEFMNAQVFGSMLQDQRDEEQRIQREIEGFSATKEASPPEL